MVKPILLGYQSSRDSATPAQLAAGHRALTAYADAEGYELAQIFTETDRTGPVSALTALIETARRTGITAIAVPTPEDLGRTRRVQDVIRQQIETRTEVRVLIIRTTDHGR